MIGRIRRYAREHGLRALLAKAAGELRNRVYRERRMTVLLKDLDSISEPRRSSGIELVPLDGGQLPALAALNRERGRPRVDRRFRDNLVRGLQGYVGRRGGEAVAYYWWVNGTRSAAHRDLRWLGNCLQIEPGDVYGSDFYVLPGHRPGGTANEMLFLVESDLRRQGYRRIWGYVDAGNREARWLYGSRGYRPMGQVSSRQFLFYRQPARPRK